MIFQTTLGCFDSAQTAYIKLVETTAKIGKWVDGISDKRSIGSSFGKSTRRTKELIGVSFSIETPRNRLFNNPVRRIDHRFAFANVLWTLSGSRKVSAIEKYNHKGQLFSHDGKHFAGALGWRMLNTSAGSQLSGVINLLRSDPNSRRAVIQFYSPTDTIELHRDTPCVLAAQLIIREGRLIMITNMRSQSVIMVLPYDLILFTMIHETISSILDIPLGPYIHICNSAHFYEDEAHLVDPLVESVGSYPEPITMVQMPRTSLNELRSVCAVERFLRVNATLPINMRRFIRLPSYWRDILGLLAA